MTRKQFLLLVAVLAAPEVPVETPAGAPPLPDGTFGPACRSSGSLLQASPSRATKEIERCELMGTPVGEEYALR